MSRSIVIGLIEGEQGRDALALGAALAPKLSAAPVLATALPYSPELIAAEQLDRALANDSGRLFAAAAEQLADLEPITRAIASRSPARALFELAEELDSLVIVVGSTSRGTLGRVYPGSVAVNLLAGAPCAVAVAPLGYAERRERGLERVGVAFDGSPESWTALESAIGLARRLSRRLTVISAIEPPDYGYGEALSVLTAEEFHTRHQQECEQTMALGMARVPDQIEAESILVKGEAADVISAASEDLDLLVIGSRGYGPLRRTVLGSVAGAVIRRAACPVLALPRGVGVDPLHLADSALDRA
jgi:nucleotide-binding universal stress UspA family protein